MPNDSPKRIAILGFHLEANRFAPVCYEADFAERTLAYGEEITLGAREENPTMDAGICGFFSVMDEAANWEPVPIAFASACPAGPADQAFFDGLIKRMRDGMAAAGKLDGVYVCEHGAGLATENDDPDGEVFELVRQAVGPDVPVIGTLDLHANVSSRMLDNTDVLIAYRTNPHVDAYERGQEAARCMLEMFDGARPRKAAIRLPLVAPTVTLLTAEGQPYGDIIRRGQEMVGPDIMNVSVVAGFAFSDLPRNGMTVVVNARSDEARAKAAAHELATAIWAERERYRKPLTSLEDATRMALDASRDPARPNLLMADVADNPGGGARGNTTQILRAFHEAGVEDALFGVFYDPQVVDAAFAAGEGATFTADFNSAETQEFSEPFSAEAEVLKLSDGEFVGRFGMVRGRTVRLGRSCLLRLGGIRIVVITIRQQCLSNDFFTHYGVDAETARCAVVKSRGHFRAGFQHIFPPERVIEVDVPGLTSPNLATFPWKQLPRPVYPMDPETTWVPPAA